MSSWCLWPCEISRAWPHRADMSYMTKFAQAAQKLSTALRQHAMVIHQDRLTLAACKVMKKTGLLRLQAPTNQGHLTGSASIVTQLAAGAESATTLFSWTLGLQYALGAGFHILLAALWILCRSPYCILRMQP